MSDTSFGIQVDDQDGNPIIDADTVFPRILYWKTVPKRDSGSEYIGDLASRRGVNQLRVITVGVAEGAPQVPGDWKSMLEIVAYPCWAEIDSYGYLSWGEHYYNNNPVPDIYHAEQTMIIIIGYA